MSQREIMNVPWTRPAFGEEEREAVDRVMRSGWLTQGREVEAFERELCEYIGCAHAVCVSSGTMGLMLAMMLVDNMRSKSPRRKIKVAAPCSTFAASVIPAMVMGAEIEYVGIDPKTLVANDEVLDAYYDSDVHMAVHLCGNVSKSANCKWLIEDACQAFGTCRTGDGMMIGAKSDLCVFSFHAAKVVSAIEGGVVVTSRKEFADILRVMRNVGHVPGAGGYEMAMPGLNGRMTDVHAAIGRVQLWNIDGFFAHRSTLAARYHSELNGYGIEFIRPTWRTEVLRHQMMPLFVDDAKRLQVYLSDKGVQTRTFFPCLTRGLIGECSCKEAQDRVLFVPIGNATTVAEVEYVCDMIKQYYETAGRG